MDPLAETDKNKIPSPHGNQLPQTISPHPHVQTPVVTPPAASAPLPMSEEEQEHKEHVPGLRTFSSDMAEAMRETQGSVVKIAIAEDERRRQENKEIEAEPRKNLWLAIASIVIILAAIGGVWGILQYKKSTAVVPPVVVVLPPSIIRSEDAAALDLTGDTSTAIVSAIAAIVANPGVQPGTVKNIILSQKTGAAGTAAVRMTASEFLSALGTHAPAQFSRALSDDFMLGVYTYDTTNLFLVLEGTSHDYLLSGMLAWEPFLLGDMAPLFNIDTSGANAALLNAPFTDTEVENIDARAVVGTDGTPVLYYSFLDPDSIIIATDQKTLTEAVSRFKQ